MTEITLKQAMKDFGPEFAMVSACRSVLCSADNKRRNAELELQLKKAGYRVRPAKGFYTYRNGATTSEPSFVVNGLTEEERKEVGHRWEQESILDEHGMHLLQEHKLVPYASKGHVKGEEAKKKQAWIQVGKHALSLALDFTKEMPD